MGQILKKTICFPPNFCCLSLPIPKNPVKISKVQHSVMCIVQQLQQRDMKLLFSFLRFKCPCLEPKVDLIITHGDQYSDSIADNYGLTQSIVDKVLLALSCKHQCV